MKRQGVLEGRFSGKIAVTRSLEENALQPERIRLAHRVAVGIGVGLPRLVDVRVDGEELPV